MNNQIPIAPWLEVAPWSRVERITYYISPTHVATFNRITPASETAGERYLFLLIFWRRAQNDIGSEEEPCLFIASEKVGAGTAPVVVVYDDAGRDVLRDEAGDWADVSTFERKAMSIASERLATTFTERSPRAGRG